MVLLTHLFSGIRPPSKFDGLWIGVKKKPLQANLQGLH